MNRPRLAAIALVLGAAACCRADEVESFPFYKDVDKADSAQEEIVAVTLDSDVYAAAEDRFADVRVKNAAGDDVPYRLDRATEARSEIVRRPCPSNVVSLVEGDDNSIEVVVELDEKAPTAGGLIFDTPLKDFERAVSVFGSNDGSDWQPLVTRGRIFDYSRYMDVANREIDLPANNYRRFKAVIEKVTDEKESALMELTRHLQVDEEQRRTERTTILRRPLRVDRIELWHDATREKVRKDKKADYPIVEFTSEEDADEKQTILLVRTRREPITRFTLQTASANFSREAVVEIPVTRGVSTDWVAVGQARISVFRFRNFEREHLQIKFPEQRQEEYRIRIANADNPPLEITGVAAEGNVYQALFFAAAGEGYRVYYGLEPAEAPSYDTAALAVALGEGYEPLAGQLGPEVPNTEFGEGPDLRLRAVLNNPLFLGVAICLMVIVLGLLLFRAGRRIEGLPEE